MNPDLNLTCTKVNTMTSINTSIGMGLLAAFEQASASGTNTKLSRLRSKMWTATSESIEIQGYFALTAVSCLTVVVNDEGASMLLHRRGYDLADNRGMVGVIPSGSHSTFLDADTPVTFLDTLKREFAEELLDVDETGESPEEELSRKQWTDLFKMIECIYWELACIRHKDISWY